MAARRGRATVAADEGRGASAPGADADDIALRLAEVACAAGAALLRAGRGDARLKADGSPVCGADLSADGAAKRALAALLPEIPVVSEESVGATAPGERFVLLDPLDGTREFLAGGDSYCVAVALIERGRAVAGAIAAPALGRLWYGGRRAWTQALGADGARQGEKRAIAVRPVPRDGPVSLVSRFHGDEASLRACAALGATACRPMSSAVKFGLIAAGEADLHVRGGATMEWDIAAGDAILAAAGGCVLSFAGERPVYGRAGGDFRNPPFVAAGSAALARRAAAAATAA